MKMKDSGAGQYRPVKCSIFEQKHAWGHHEACSRSQRTALMRYLGLDSDGDYSKVYLS